jgi:hypothetical protein
VNPKYIFSAVFAVCIFLILGLPKIAQPAPAAMVAAAPASFNLPAPIPTTAPEPTAPAAAAPPELVIEEAPPAEEPALEAPVFQPPPEGQPSPTPLITGSGQIPRTNGLPELSAFTASLENKAADLVAGVYVPGLFALPVLEQPMGEENYVTNVDGAVTRYRSPARFGTTALLAHNYLSGKAFFSLKPDQEILLIYGDQRTARYRVSSIQHYQALSPNDPYSNFVDLSDPQATLLTFQQVFDRVYTTPGQLVFQTCLEANGDLSWGRIFVLAQPVQ